MTESVEVEKSQPLEAEPSATGDDGARPFMPTWTRLVVGLLAGLAATVLVIVVVSPNITGDIQAAQRATTEPLYLLAALGCVAVYLAADAWSLVVMSRACCRVPTSAVVKIALESHFVGGASSFGGLEIPYQVVMLRRLGMSSPQATSVVVIKGVLHAALLVVVALAALLPWIDSPVTALQRRLLLILALAVLLGGFVARLWTGRPVGLGLLPARLRSRAHEFATAVHQFHGSPRVYAEFLALQLVYWVAMFAVLLFILHALGWRGSAVPIVIGQAVMQVLMPLSPLPGGAGVAEFSYLTLIGPSTPSTIMVPSLVLWRVATFVVPVATGALTLGVRGANHGR